MTFQFFLTQQNQFRTISFKVISDGQIFTFRTPLKISTEEWDEDRQRPKNIYLKEFKKLNLRLNRIKIEVSAYTRKRDEEGKSFSIRTVSRKIEKICKETKPVYAENSLLYFVDMYVASRKELICKSTFKRYKVFKRLIERFEGFVAKRLIVDGINSEFVNEFLVFGKSEEYSENTIYRSIHFVKTILNFAERKGIRTYVRELEIRREKQKKEVITLTEQEILKIKETNVPKSLQPAKDWLIISCYTGQRFSDFIKFDRQQLQTINDKICLSFIQQKTKKKILLPLHPTVVKAIERNGNGFPKLMDIQDYNNDIKEIARISSLNDRIKARKRLGFRTKEIEVEKWEILSSHIGRRSFATNFYGKIPTPLLMEATGHSTEQMFLRYINPVNKDRVLALGGYFDRMYEERVAV